MRSPLRKRNRFGLRALSTLKKPHPITVFWEASKQRRYSKKVDEYDQKVHDIYHRDPVTNDTAIREWVQEATNAIRGARKYRLLWLHSTRHLLATLKEKKLTKKYPRLTEMYELSIRRHKKALSELRAMNMELREARKELNIRDLLRYLSGQ